jgi:hypothetical protein
LVDARLPKSAEPFAKLTNHPSAVEIAAKIANLNRDRSSSEQAAILVPNDVIESLVNARLPKSPEA